MSACKGFSGILFLKLGVRYKDIHFIIIILYARHNSLYTHFVHVIYFLF